MTWINLLLVLEASNSGYKGGLNRLCSSCSLARENLLERWIFFQVLNFSEDFLRGCYSLRVCVCVCVR